MSIPMNPDGHELPPSVTTETTVRTGAGTPVTARVMVTNRAAGPRIMAVTAMGTDASWLPKPSRSRVLQPGETVLAELRLSPAVGTVPARYPIALAVQALDPITEQATASTTLQELQLIVDAPGQIGIELTPLDATAVFGKKIAVTLRNAGGTPAQVHLATQATQSAPVHLDENEVHLRAGEVRKIGGRVRVRRVRLVGHRARHAYSVTAHSAGAPRHVEASLTARAMLGPTSAKATALIAIVAVWVALAIIFIPKLADSIKGKHEITAQSVQTAAATGGAGASGGGGSTGSRGGSGSGGSGGGGSGGGQGGSNGGSGGAAGAKAIQLNGTVTGSKPSGVDVTIKQTTLQAEDAIDATPVGVTTRSAETVGKIPAASLLTPLSADEPTSRSVVTDTDGAWSFSNIAQPGYYLVTFAKPGYQTARYIVNSVSAAAAKPLEVALVPGKGKLSGMINGPGGPVGGAQITITDGTNTITTSSNSQGRVGAWSVDGLSTPSTYLVSAGKSGLSTESALVTLGAGESSSVSLRLSRGAGSLVGLISGSNGSLGGASVTATNGKITRTATSITKGAVGRYVLPDLPEPGSYTVTVSADGYQPQSQRLTLHAGESSRQLNASLVSATATINGTVRSSGKAVAGAGLTLSSTDNTYKITSTNEGGFSFDGVAAGTYVLSAQYFGLVTGYVTVTAVPGQTRFTTVELKPAPEAVSHSSVTGFVADGGNPSNTLCAGTSSTCQVSFRLCKARGGDGGLCAPGDYLVISADGKTFSTNPSIAPANSGPTAYTLTAPKDVGLAPGIYHLTISTTDAKGKVSYLPATVNVQVPLNGVAHAPQVSLYTASGISGVVRSTYDWSASGKYTSCVWAVPSDSTFAPTDCVPQYAPLTSPCATSGKASATVGDIDPQGGSYSIANLCNGSYRMTIITMNPDFAAATTSASPLVTVLNGSPGYFNGQIFRDGQLQFFLTYPNPSDASAVALSNTTLDAGSACTPTSSGGKTINLAGKKTDGGGALLITGLTPANYVCTLKATTPGGRAVSAITPGSITTNWDTTLVEHLILDAPIAVFVGQVTTSWTGSPQPVSGIQVSVTGVVGYDNEGKQILSPPDAVTTDAKGCFAVAPLGSAPPSPPTAGPCKDDAAIPTTYLNLRVPKASFDVAAQAGFQATHEGDVDVSADAKTSVIGLDVDPNPVTFSIGVSAPTSVNLADVKVNVTDSASGSGDITPKISLAAGSTTTGSISWTDSLHSGGKGNQGVPGGYTLRFTSPDMPTWNYRIVCEPGVECTKSITLHEFGTLQVGGVPDGADVTLYNNGTQVGNPKTASNGSVEFDNLLPTDSWVNEPTDPGDGDSWPDDPKPLYTVRVQAAGYQFGTTGATGSPTSIACGSGANVIPIAEGDTATACAVTLTPDGSISGTLTGIKAKSPAATPTQALNDVKVTAQLCASPVTLPATTCTLATGAAARSFFDTTNGQGGYTIVGTDDVQGLDPGYWLVTTHADGYGDPDGSGTPRSRVVQITKDSMAPTGVDFTLYVSLLDTFAVTVDDGNGGVLTKDVTSVTMTSDGGATKLTATYVAKNKDFEFTNVVPGQYDISAEGTQFSLTTDNGVQVDASNTSHTVHVGLHSNTVTGTVLGDQGTQLAAALDGVKVEIGTLDDDGNFTVSKDATGKNDMTTTTPTGGQASGSFSFTAVPDSPDGGWTIQMTRAGYTLTRKTIVVDPTHVQQGLRYTMPRVTHDVSIEVTSKSGKDDLSNVTATLVSVDDSSNSPDNATQTLTITAGTTKDSFTASAKGVPYGCWKLVTELPANHYGTVTMTSTPEDDDYLDCKPGSITVPSTGTTEIDPTYSVDEAALDISLTATTSATDADGTLDTVPAMTVAVAKGTDSPLYQNDDFPTTGTVTVWLPSPGTYTASVEPADSASDAAWPTSADSTKTKISLDTSDSTPAALSISELPVVHVSVDGASDTDKATVTISPGTGQTASVPAAYLPHINTAGGTIDLYLPAGNWDVTATLGTDPNQQAGYATVTAAVATAATKTLTPAWASLAVSVDGAATDNVATVVLTCTDTDKDQSQPADCADGITHTDDGTGTTFTGLAAGDWTIDATTPDGKQVTKSVTLIAGEAGDDADGDGVADDETVDVTPKFASITVTVTGTDGKTKITGADVDFVPGSDQSATAPGDASGKTGTGGTFTVDDMPIGSWTINVSYTDKDKNEFSGTAQVTLHGGTNDGKPITLKPE